MSTYILLSKQLADIQDFTFRITSWVSYYGPRIVFGLLMLVLGWWLIGRIINLMGRVMDRRQVDPTLAPFLKSVTGILLKVFLVISILTMAGFSTASLITALGAAGLAIGLALQGSLSNFAGGVLILLFKPFRVGDFIEAQGKKGTVREIQILYTVLVSADGKKVVIPNGNLSNQEITNFSTEPLRRIEYTVFMPYSVSATQATRIMREAALADPLVMREPEPWSGVGDLTWQGMRVDLWAWVQRTDYITVHPRLGEAIAERFRQANIPLGGQNYDIQLKRD